MMIFDRNVNCPECKKENIIEFSFSYPEDGDEETKEIICKCGCEFEITAEAQVDVFLLINDPIIIKSQKKDFDIMDTSTCAEEKKS